MTKQELAAKIWGSTNELRGNIELGTYKDYMLSLLFYKFLSDKEESYLLDQGWTKEDMKSINEDDTDSVADCQRNLGYFIAYDNLFSTWIALEHDFTVRNVTDALNAFDRLIGDSHKRVFSKIFETLQSNISNLGTTAADQTKALSKLIEVINDIPADQAQGYDVLGFIYEFLIGNFAANAGKKAGEFYTPHEVSVLMSEIISHHLRGRDTIRILDPTSGSGSLLITIGKAFAKYSGGKDNVEYYAQEFIKSTYNLTRMNLIMKGILPNNIHVRNGDTLASDWPYFDDSDPDNTYFPLPVDAVVSNPPYSQNWDPSNREGDPRFSSYGIAPKGKADYAFLLYDLYHIRPDGIAAVILPHGVLLRGNEESTIRQNLIDNNKIDAIIGLPENMFFGTPLETILVILKQTRETTDVLFVDASKGFVKNGNKNKLRSRDIKRIADVVIGRRAVPKFSRIVPKSEIIDNGYNLNISRYVDSSEPNERWNVYSLMLGGTPNEELDGYDTFWKAFPSLRAELFKEFRSGYSNVITEDISRTVLANSDVQAFIAQYHDRFDDFEKYLRHRWLDHPESVVIPTEEDVITSEIFRRYEGMPLADPYAAYQALDDQYSILTTDLELIQVEGFSTAVQKVDPNLVTKKKDDKTIEVQEGWKGHILPFELVQRLLLPEDVEELNALTRSLQHIQDEYEDILGSLSQEELDSNITNDEGTAFASKGITEKVKEVLADVTSPEIDALQQYLLLLTGKAKRPELTSYIASCTAVNWGNMEVSKGGTFTRSVVSKYITVLQQQFAFDPESFEFKVLHVSELMDYEKTLKKRVKEKMVALEEKTKAQISCISDEDAKRVLAEKWIIPLVTQIRNVPDYVLKEYTLKLNRLAKKYAITMTDLDADIKAAEAEILEMLKDLHGESHSLEGLQCFATLLGEPNSKMSIINGLFPKPGSNSPEIRFSGFTDPWEVRKWVDTVDISTEMVDPNSGEYDEMPHIAPGNIESFTGRILDNVKTVKEEQLISGKFRFRPGDVVYGKINPQLGKYFYATCDGLTSADAYVFNGKNGITQKFLYSVLQTEDFYRYSVSVSKRSGMPKINRDELNAYCFYAPKEEGEQNRIGAFLLCIDNLISLYQRKLKILGNLKLAMRQNMFPVIGRKKDV